MEETGSGPYRLTSRVGPRVEKDRFASLGDALDALEDRLAGGPGRPAARERQVLGRTYDPVQQVAGRFELRGPRGLRAGVDLRGDGSAEAYLGRVRKRLVEQQAGETPLAALRRELA